MKAILISSPPTFELVDIPVPRCNSGYVLVRTDSCGVCGTDLEILRGSMANGFVRYPLIPGHEWTGVVEEVGRDVRNVHVGDRVSVEGCLSCGICAHCRASEVCLCESHEQIGLTHNGGFAEFVTAPASLCHRVPDNVSLEEAVMVEPAATVVRGIERARIRPGARVAIIGCGPIGQITARVLSLHVPTMILGIDVSETQRSMAVRAGMTEFVTTQNHEELRQLSDGEGWDVVVNCATGSTPLELAFAIARRGASIVIFGTAPDEHRFNISANRLVMGDLQVEGVLGYTSQSWESTLRLLATRELKFHDLITHRVPLADFGRAIQLVERKTEPMGKVVVSYNGAAGSPAPRR